MDPSSTGTPPANSEGEPSLRVAIDALEDRLEQERAATDRSSEDLAGALIEVEQELLQRRRELEEQHQRDAEAALSANLRHWEQELRRLELEAEADEAHALLGRWMTGEVEAWNHAAARDDWPGAEERLEALRRASSLERARIAHLGDGAGSEDPLEATRRELQDQLRDLEVSEGARRRHAIWLLDASAQVLSALDEQSTDAACLALKRTSAELAWCLAHVPPAKGRLRTRLALRRRRLRAELEERQLQQVLENKFGVACVARLERIVLVLIFVVLGLFTLELTVDVPDHLHVWMIGLEAAACTVFLTEFFLKLALVPEGRWRWFARHFFVDLVPSIPFGLIASMEANPAQAGRMARLLRLPRIVRYVRVLLPVLRLLRVVAFLARGMDRIARAHRTTLNRDVVITPNRRERARARARGANPQSRLEHIEANLQRAWVDVLHELDPLNRPEWAVRRTELFRGAWRDPATDLEASGGRAEYAPARIERTAEEVLHSLQTADPSVLARTLGGDTVRRLARALRALARVRWLPLLCRIVPEGDLERSDDELVAACARKIGRELSKHHARMYWFADLHGTITPSEMVDRAGTALVKSSIRPATRLLIFGGAYVVLIGLLQLVQPPEAGTVTDPTFFQSAAGSVVNLLERFVGTTLIVLGSICLAILGVGSWLKRLAQDATAFFEQAGSAQFLSLTEAIRNRTMRRDLGWLDARIVAPETPRVERAGQVDPGLDDDRRQEIFERTVRDWLLYANASSDGIRHEPTRAALERVVLLYRDALDGALLGESDTRCTSQLLGNPALAQLRERSHRTDKRERKQLAALDLERGSGLRGPYLWFSLISRSVARSAARLIVEYNRNAIPSSELDLVSEEEREAYEAWIAAHPVHSGPGPSVRQTTAPQASSYRTSAFTALHFLDDDPARDAAVAARFGEGVLELLQEDRRLLFCRIFGTYPLHQRPKNERFLNVARLYDEWLQAGRVFLLPLRLLGLSFQGVGRLVRSVVRAVREVRDPRLRNRIDPKEGADFDTAVRKIDRMRGPGVREALHMRARFDPEYLGLALPGLPPPSASLACVEHDLEFLGLPAGLGEEVAEERERARGDLRRLAHLLENGLEEELVQRLGRPLDEETRRALALAYCGDLEGVRSLLSAPEILTEAFDREPLDGSRLTFLSFARALRKALRTWLARHPGDTRKVAWRALRENRWGCRQALECWSAHEGSGPTSEGAARAEQRWDQGVERLVELLRHPASLSEERVNLRAVQSLSLLDMLHYREHVWRLTGFAERGDDPGRRLDLKQRAAPAAHA